MTNEGRQSVFPRQKGIVNDSDCMHTYFFVWSLVENCCVVIRWEIKQLIAAGVLDAKDYPLFDDEAGVLNFEETEEELDIELNDNEPSFLKGQTTMSGMYKFSLPAFFPSLLSILDS